MSHVKDRTQAGRGWIAVLTDPDARNGERSKSPFPSEEAAWSWIREQEALMHASKYVTPERAKTPFKEVYESWLKVVNRGRIANTQETAGYYARSLVLPHLGHMAVGSMTDQTDDDWINDLIEAGYAPATIRKAHDMAHGVMDHAVKLKCTVGNPFIGTKLPKLERKVQRYLKTPEVVALSCRVTETYRARDYGTWCLVNGFGGLRAEESFALQVRGIDTVRPELDIFQACTEVDGKIVFGPCKTLRSTRRVQIPEFVWHRLLEETRGRSLDDLVFPAPNGGPVRLRNFRKRVWYPSTVAAGQGQWVPCTRPTEGACIRCVPGTGPFGPLSGVHYVGLRIHDLRHTAISLWIKAGTDPLTVSVRAGHYDVGFTYSHYGHLYSMPEDPHLAGLSSEIELHMATLRSGIAA